MTHSRTFTSNNRDVCSIAAADLPYRVSPVVTYCEVCDEQAIFCCIRCGRPFCGRHAATGTCCADCELEYANKLFRVKGVYWVVFTATATLCTLYLAWSNIYAAIMMAGAFVLLGMLLAGVCKKITRACFMAGSKAEDLVLDNANLRIAPLCEASEPARMIKRVPYARSGRARGETPTPPIYARTYGVG